MSSDYDSSVELGRRLSSAVVMFHEAVAKTIGLSATEWKCLDILIRNGPSTAKVLSDQSGLSTGAITGIIDRLEREKLATREDNPADRRSVIIHPVPREDLSHKLSPIFASLNVSMQGLMLGFNESERACIQNYLTSSISILEEETRKLTSQKNRSNSL